LVLRSVEPNQSSAGQSHNLDRQTDLCLVCISVATLQATVTAIEVTWAATLGTNLTAKAARLITLKIGDANTRPSISGCHLRHVRRLIKRDLSRHI